MSHAHPLAWAALLGLGAWHGINPAMGWLFAVALGLQQQRERAVWHSLLPIAAGHLAAIGLVVALAVLGGAMLPASVVRIGVAALLGGCGVYRLIVKTHPRWGGMQVGVADLTIWSFLMATAHGAGLMLLPVLLEMSRPGGHEAHGAALPGIATASMAVAVHTLGYLLVTGGIAWVVYRRLGLALLRTAWLNLDRIWAGALLATAALTLLMVVQP